MYIIMLFCSHHQPHPLLRKNGFFTTTRPSLPKEGSWPSLNLTLSTSVATRQCPSELALLSLLHQFSPHGERLNTGNRGNRRFPSVFGIAGHAMSFIGWRGDG